jgi:hypothetical protein
MAGSIMTVFVRFLVDYPAYIHQMTDAYDKNVLM